MHVVRNCLLCFSYVLRLNMSVPLEWFVVCIHIGKADAGKADY